MSVQALMDNIADVAGVPKTSARTAVDAVVSTAAHELAAGRPVTIPGLGTFSVVERAAKTGRNPRTGEEIQIAAQRKVKFKPSKALRDRLNPPQ